jgi:hypothetical protein
VAVNYGRDIGWSGSRATEVQRDGETTFLTSFNDRGQEIGVWRAVVARATFDELVARLRASGYERLATEGTLDPGTKVVTIGERLEGEKLPILYTFATVPPELEPVIALLDAVETRVRTNPVRVLRGSAAWANAEVRRGDPAVVEMRMTNVGVQPFEMSNPLHDFAEPGHGRGGWNGLRLVFSKEGAHGGDEQYDIAAADVRAPPDAARSETCLLQPGQGLRFEIRKDIHLVAGKYRSRVEYNSIVDRDTDPSFVGGVLSLDPGPLAVSGGPWWKVW